MRPSASGQPRLSTQHFSPKTRQYSIHSNKPVFLSVENAIFTAFIAIIVPFLTWPSFPAFVLVFLIIGWTYKKLTTVFSETVLILGPLGVQISSTNSIGVTHRFIAREHIVQAIIHEAIDGWNIVFYLALIIESDDGEMSTVQIFKNLRPRLTHLIPVWKGIREILFHDKVELIPSSTDLPSTI